MRRRRGAHRASLREHLARPVDAASLALFRIGYGLVMALESVSLLMPEQGMSPLARFFLTPPVRFPYPGLAWLPAWPEWLMSLEVALMGVLSALLVVGRAPRAAALGITLIWSHVWLLEATLYNNHFYLMSLLGLLLALMPSGAAFRLGGAGFRIVGAAARIVGAPARADGAAARPGEARVGLGGAGASGRVPFWTIGLLRAQLFFVYFYAGVAKLSHEWLVLGEPMRTELASDGLRAATEAWLPSSVAAVMQSAGFAQFLSWAGAALDLSVGFLLLLPRTRLLAVFLLVGFHGSNHFLLFDDIGWFPLLGLLSTPIFLPPDWPRRLGRLVRGLGRSQGNGLGLEDLPRPDARWMLVGSLLLASVGAALAAPLGAGRFGVALLGLPVGLLLGWRLADEAAPALTAAGREAVSPLGALAIAAFVVVQAVVPLRHFAIPGAVAWTAEGGRFAWRMKSHSKIGGSIRMRIDDPGLALRAAPGPHGIDWAALPGVPLLLEEVDPFALDWSRQPETVSVWSAHTGERVYRNPFAVDSGDAVSPGAGWVTTWEHAEVLRRIGLVVAEAGQATALRDALGALSAQSPRARREALAWLARDPEIGEAVRAILVRSRPFVEDGGPAQSGEFLVQRSSADLDPDDDDRADERERHVLVRPHAPDATLDPDLPLAFVLQSTRGRREVAWNPWAELGRRQMAKLRTEPHLLFRYARAVAERWRGRTGRRPRIHVDVTAALVPYDAQRLVDPLADLATARDVGPLDSDAAILPLQRSLTRGSEKTTAH